MNKKRYIYIILFLAMVLGFYGCKESVKTDQIQEKNIVVVRDKIDTKKIQPEKKISEIKVTFIELGSVKCVPCKMMQPIIEEIKKEYKEEVKVIFYDIWTSEGRPFGKQYGVRVIPTQVFLDKDGKEYFRHEGFFPKDDLIKVLKMQGVQ